MEIISNFHFSFSKICSVICILVIAGSPAVLAADRVLQKVPALSAEQAPAYPQNLARHHLGAKVEAFRAGNEAAASAFDASLLSGDPTANYPLPAGVTTLMISLPNIENLEQVTFSNHSTTGSLTVATSSAKMPADSPQWHCAPRQALDATDVKTKVGPSDAKYVRLTFDVAQPGTIAGLGIYATPAISDVTDPRRGKVSGASFGYLSYSLTNLHARARALYVSSGAEIGRANSMIDDQPATSYTFGSDDASPVAVVDLGRKASLRRLSALYAPHAGHLYLYVLDSLPGSVEGSAFPKDLKLTETALASLKPVGSISDDGARGQGSIEFPTTVGRYVMLRWSPAARGNGPFTVAELAAFGPDKSNTLLAAHDTAVQADPSAEQASPDNDEGSSTQSHGKEVLDGKDVLDAKDVIDAKDTPAEGPEQPPAEGPPPNLPAPPPFTFIPQLTPTSP